MTSRITFVGVRCRCCGQPFEARIQERPVRMVGRFQFMVLRCDLCGRDALYPHQELHMFLKSNPHRSN